MALRLEFQQLLDEFNAHPGEPLATRVHHVIREGIDVAGVILNAGANSDEIANELVDLTRQLIRGLDIGAIAKRIADSGVAFVVPPIVEQLAQYAGTAQEFVDAKVIPQLDEIVLTLQDIRQALQPAA